MEGEALESTFMDVEFAEKYCFYHGDLICSC